MKTTRALTTLFAALCGITASAATEYTADTTLGADVNETTELKINGSNAIWIDLNGHDLTLDGTLTVGSQWGNVITNSSATLATATFKCSNNLQQEFQKITFGGNLKLVVSGNCSSNGGFQDRENTHTGGTVLDGYGTESGAQIPRFKTATAFGSTSLTMKNGSRVMNKGGGMTMAFTDLYFEDDTIKYLRCGDNITLETTTALHIPAGARGGLQAESGKGYFNCDMSDVKGILSLGGSFTQLSQPVSSEATIELQSGAQVRINYDAEKRTSYNIPALQTHPDITAANNAKIVNTTDWQTLPLFVGSANTDTTWYGNIGNDASHASNRKNIRLFKIGTGTLTLGGTNEYCSTTIISNGALRVIGDGTIGYPSSNQDIIFAGGSVVFGADVADDPSARFKTADSTQVAKIGVGEGVTQTIAGNLANCVNVEKTLAGTLVVPTGITLTGDLTVTAGTLSFAGDATWASGTVTNLATAASMTAISGSNYTISNLGPRQSYTLEIVDDGNNTSALKATITNTELVWTKGDGKWSDENAWNNDTLTYQAGDVVKFTAASFGEADEITVEIDSDVAPAGITFDIPSGKTLVLSGSGKIAISDKTITIPSGTLALGADQPFADVDYTLNLEQGATLDLRGHSLFVGTATQLVAADSSALVTNSVADVLGTFTAGCNNGYAYSNRRYVFGGYTRYVTTSHSEDTNLRFWGGDCMHSGGTVFSNVNHRVRSPKQFGSGSIVLTQGAKMDLASNNPVPYDYGTWSNAFEAYGTGNTAYFGASAGVGTYNVTGPVIGDGELAFEAGWNWSVALRGDLSRFTGTLNAKVRNTTAGRGLWINPDNAVETAGAPNAILHLVNPSGSNVNEVFLQKTGTMEFGAVMTPDTMPTNSFIYAGAAVTLKTGTKADATYAGNFADYNGNVLSIEKVGDTTWTLTGTNHNFSGTFTVTGGTVVFSNSVATAYGSSVVVGANGTIAATSTPVISSPITFSDGAKVKLAGELDTTQEYTILTAGSGSTGKASVVVDDPPTKGTWKTKWIAGEGDTKVLKGYFAKPGFVLIVR